MKLTVKTPKPRNPLVVPALQRRAGAHRPASGALRQRARRDLRGELDRLRHSP